MKIGNDGPIEHFSKYFLTLVVLKLFNLLLAGWVDLLFSIAIVYAGLSLCYLTGYLLLKNKKIKQSRFGRWLGK